MKAHIYSSINAHPLLHELERTAREMQDTYSKVDVPFHGGSTHVGQLTLAGSCEGEETTATIAQHSEKILVAALGDASLDPLTAKRRLAAFLGPLLKRYNETEKQNLAPDDKAAMIFQDDIQKV
jgi:hypothetical protein